MTTGMIKTNGICMLALALPLLLPATGAAQQPPNVPAEVRQAEDEVEEAVRRFRIGVTGGVALDPELIIVGAHGAFGPIFHPTVEVRPGVEVGIGELTTMLGINLDVLYRMPARGGRGWRPYVGAGPNFALSHKGFETEDTGNVDGAGDRDRFDFSDTDFEGGLNVIAGARSRGGTFFELKATAWGVTNIRLLAGFNF